MKCCGHLEGMTLIPGRINQGNLNNAQSGGRYTKLAIIQRRVAWSSLMYQKVASLIITAKILGRKKKQCPRTGA